MFIPVWVLMVNLVLPHTMYLYILWKVIEKYIT